MPSLKTLLCLGLVIFGIWSKVWLVTGSQIVDGGDDPHEYVNQVLHPANEGMAYGPGTGLVARLFHFIHLPFRWGIEILFILALLLMLRALIEWPWNNYVAAALFLLLLFDPAPEYLFSSFMSDQIWLVETMIGFSLFAIALEDEPQPGWLRVGLASLILGLSAITRSTVTPLVLSLVVLAMVSYPIFLLRRPRPHGFRSMALLSLAVLTLLLATGFIYGGTCWYNFRCYGYHGISVLDSSEYKKFFFCLQSVGEPTGDKYFPIDEQRRKLIASAGPVSSGFIQEIEKENALKAVGRRNYGKADFPTGWFHFAAFDVVLGATHGNLRNAFLLFQRIEQEISSAHAQGRLQVRSIVPLPDSRLDIVRPLLPGAWLRTMDELAWEPTPGWRKDQTAHGVYQNPDFKKALRRGRASESPAQARVSEFLDHAYVILYHPLLVNLLWACFVVFLVIFVIRWKHLEHVSPGFFARQSFFITFVAMMCWYTLFDASGLPVLSRYMIFNHVALPILIAFYIRQILRLLDNDIVEL